MCVCCGVSAYAEKHMHAKYEGKSSTWHVHVHFFLPTEKEKSPSLPVLLSLFCLSLSLSVPPSLKGGARTWHSIFCCAVYAHAQHGMAAWHAYLSHCSFLLEKDGRTDSLVSAAAGLEEEGQDEDGGWWCVMVETDI